MIFLSKRHVLEVHRRALEEFGGAQGVLNDDALESALISALNRLHYEQADLATCAATYAFHLTQAHAFVDGNKRVAAALSLVFVAVNGGTVRATENGLFELFMQIASGALTREHVERWFKDHLT